MIREIQKEDNKSVETFIKNVFPEFGVPQVGTAYEDPETSAMFEAYQSEREVYYVIVINGKPLGGAGIKPLRDNTANVCELQKMYFAPEIRGKGYGKALFEKCLQAAKDFGYDQCYIETTPQFKAAIHIYELFGFKHLDQPLGNTGHYSCGIWMLKDL